MTLFLLALALSMDAFAAAISQGAHARPAATTGSAIRVGLAFGAAQGLMPLIGWLLGVAFASVIRDVDHWIAFVLLGVLGARMVVQGLAGDASDDDAPRSVAAGMGLFALAIATSVDAAAAGVTLPTLGYPVILACAVIAIVTLVLSTGGVMLGKAVGSLVGRRAEVFGGIILIGIGVKILVDHLGEG